VPVIDTRNQLPSNDCFPDFSLKKQIPSLAFQKKKILTGYIGFSSNQKASGEDGDSFLQAK